MNEIEVHKIERLCPSATKQTRTTLAQLKDRCVINPTTGCWEWQGAVSDHGYGSLTVNQKRKVAPRYAKELSIGRELETEEHVRHTCDNPPCVNPDHLIVGTRQENIDDMRAKGRGCNPPIHRGEDQHSAKLSEEDVRAIRKIRAEKSESIRKLAKRLGVSACTIKYIQNVKSWGWLK